MPRFTGISSEYNKQSEAVVVDAVFQDDFNKTAHRFIAHKQEYQAIAERTHVPWPLRPHTATHGSIPRHTWILP
jgi:lysozyme family protein